MRDDSTIRESDLASPRLQMVNLTIGQGDDLESRSGRCDHIDLDVVGSQIDGETLSSSDSNEGAIEMSNSAVLVDNVLNAS